MHPKLGEVQYIQHYALQKQQIATSYEPYFSFLFSFCPLDAPPARTLPKSAVPFLLLPHPPQSSRGAPEAAGPGFLLTREGRGKPLPSLVGISSALRATASYDDCLSSNEKPQGQQEEEEEEFASSPAQQHFGKFLPRPRGLFNPYGFGGGGRGCTSS